MESEIIQALNKKTMVSKSITSKLINKEGP